MTHSPDLPPELQRLEQDLAERPRPDPEPGLRERILHAVESELDRRRAEEARPGHDEPTALRPKRTRPNGWWAFAVGLAAVVLVWLNLSLSAAQATSYNFRLPTGSRPVDATARKLRELLPEIPRGDALRYAVLLEAGSRLIECPNVAAGSAARASSQARQNLFSQGE